MKYGWFFLIIVTFIVFHSNTVAGPDSEVYLHFAHNIVTKGHLNILTETLATDEPNQITRTHHAPVHQNIGGVIFIVPATALAVVSHYAALQLSGVPPRFHDIEYHEALWLGMVTYFLLIGTCFFTYRVARHYHDSRSSLLALLFCGIGGPLLLYAVRYPCNTNLPTAFLASLLLYVHLFSDKRLARSWLLTGIIFGLGLFVRFEFAVWGILLAYGFTAGEGRPASSGEIVRRAGLAMIGCLLFVIPGVMVQKIIYGHLVNAYVLQSKLDNIAKIGLLLFGTRNGLFVYWPIFFVSLTGYCVGMRRAAPLYHVLFGVIVFLTLACCTIIFWNGELGYSFGQRWFLAAFPCFVLFLARLFDMAKRTWLLVIVCSLCTVWAVLLWAAYGNIWYFPGDITGFLMPLHFSRLTMVLTTYYPLFLGQAARLLCVPKHGDVFVLLPVAVASMAGLYALGRRCRKKMDLLLGALLILAFAAIGFLFSAERRGEAAFREIAAANREAQFVYRNYEVNFEILSSMADSMAFFAERGDQVRVEHIRQNTMDFLRREAPDKVATFATICEALELRKTLGWYRLFPEQIHFELLTWYNAVRREMLDGKVPAPLTARYLY